LQEKLTVSIKEMAELLNISLPTAYKLTKTEGFPVLMIGKRQLIPIQGLQAWMKKNTETEMSNDK
jgi:excisionase family DNA binding protein